MGLRTTNPQGQKATLLPQYRSYWREYGKDMIEIKTEGMRLFRSLRPERELPTLLKVYKGYLAHFGSGHVTYSEKSCVPDQDLATKFKEMTLRKLGLPPTLLQRIRMNYTI